MVIPKGTGPSFFGVNKSVWWRGNQMAAGGTFPTDRQPAPLLPTCALPVLSKPTALQIPRIFTKEKETDTSDTNQS